MKSYLLFLIFTFSSFTFAKTVKIDVPGMVCQMCVQGMQKNFKEVVNNPQKDVIVDLDKMTVTVTLSKEITEKEIRNRVQDAGYNAKKIDWLKSE